MTTELARKVYTTAMGTIVRCPGCGEALICIAHGPQRYWIDFSRERLAAAGWQNRPDLMHEAIVQPALV